MDGKEFRHFAAYDPLKYLVNGARRLAPSSERLDRLTTPGETPRGGPAQVPGTQR
jgi:hypothetical protein